MSVSLSFLWSKYSRPCFNRAPSTFRPLPSSFSSILRTFVAHMRISSSILLAVAAFAADTSLLCYLPSVLIPFSLICLYSRPTHLASRFPVTVSLSNIPFTYLFPSPLRTCVYNALFLCHLFSSSLFVHSISLRILFLFQSLFTLHRRGYWTVNV